MDPRAKAEGRFCAPPFRLLLHRPGLSDHQYPGWAAKPGLLRQHVTAVKAAAAISDAHVEGCEVSSRTLTFKPRGMRPGKYSFSIGTAGSSTLVFQTVLPALLTAPGPSLIRISGGTHNAAAPAVDFLSRSFLPLIARMGPTVTLNLGALWILSPRWRRDRRNDHSRSSVASRLRYQSVVSGSAVTPKRMSPEYR